MWARFRKKDARGGHPAPDLISGIRALQALFWATAGFLLFEWLRGRELPFEFLIYGILSEALLYAALWSAFRTRRLSRQRMHVVAVWVAAAISLPISVYLTLVDAGGEIRYLLLLVWFLSYSRNHALFLTALYLAGTLALLLLSGKFQFFAGNDPVRSLMRATLLAATLLPLMLYVRSHLLRRSAMPIRLTHLSLQLIQGLKIRTPAASAGFRAVVPDSARHLWKWIRSVDRSPLFVRKGPEPGIHPAVLIRMDLLDVHRFADDSLPSSRRAAAIQQRLLEIRQELSDLCLQAGLWMDAGLTSFVIWQLKASSGEESPASGPAGDSARGAAAGSSHAWNGEQPDSNTGRGSGIGSGAGEMSGTVLVEKLAGFINRWKQDRKASAARGLISPRMRWSLYCGPALLLSESDQIRIRPFPESWSFDDEGQSLEFYSYFETGRPRRQLQRPAGAVEPGEPDGVPAERSLREERGERDEQDERRKRDELHERDEREEPPSHLERLDESAWMDRVKKIL